MDRDRLKEVHQTDLTESRINEDFVEWLKKKGPTWLLVVLIAVCSYLAIVNFREKRRSYESEAWQALFAADLPGALEDIADEYDDVGQIASFARLSAARRLLRLVQAGTSLDLAPQSDPNNPTAPIPVPDPLTPDDRVVYLKRAENLYQAVLDADPGDMGSTLFAITALNGMAAIAECRGDVTAAQQWYDKSADRAGTAYPLLADQARARAASADEYTSAVQFKSQAEISAATPAAPDKTPVRIDPALRDLIMPAEETDAG